LCGKYGVQFGYRGKVLVEELRRSDVLSAYNVRGCSDACAACYGG
jgi:hypothetical protein